jgi:hypothetical protein
VARSGEGSSALIESGRENGTLVAATSVAGSPHWQRQLGGEQRAAADRTVDLDAGDRADASAREALLMAFRREEFR